MTDSDRQLLIWLSAVPGVGIKTLDQILKQAKNYHVELAEIVKKSDSFLKKLTLKNSQIDSLRAFQKEYSPTCYEDFLSSKNIQTVCFEDESYPRLLTEISSIPYVLYVKGQSHFWNTLPISVVGTRHLTSYGDHATRVITSELIDLGATIISGFMYGADCVAHETAIQKNGKSVAVLGYGFDFLPQLEEPYHVEKFLETGNVFISEFAPFVSAHKGNFPMRNRIVAGMSLATVVTEAAERSGSLITAQYALDFNRSVCAIPGPFHSLYSQGTKNLINQGAKLVTSGLEVISETQPASLVENNTLNRDEKVKEKVQGLVDDVEKTIVLLLHSESFSAQELSEKMETELTILLPKLSVLEVKGLIYRKGNKWWSYL